MQWPTSQNHQFRQQVENYFSRFGAIEGVKLSFTPGDQKPTAVIKFADAEGVAEVFSPPHAHVP
jgi:hypothetical protein